MSRQLERRPGAFPGLDWSEYDTSALARKADTPDLAVGLKTEHENLIESNRTIVYRPSHGHTQ
jgi:hypothetical protein